MKFDLNDILIEPKKITNISSREEILPFDSYGFLPLITAPMDTVISKINQDIFSGNRIMSCLPRGEYLPDHKIGVFHSYSLNEFDSLVNTKELNENGWYLIDIANGHMDKLLHLTRKVKTLYPKITLMVGNIANPETYCLLSEAGADYIRVGIGNGGGCLTTQNTGVGYPMGSLIKECHDQSLYLNNPAKIVADGGMKDYSDVIKSLALGADYVMLGSILNKSLESSGDFFLFKKIKIPAKLGIWLFNHKIPVFKKFRGMSTKEVQKKWGKNKIKTSEGVIRFRKVEYTVNQWSENFEHYLRSAMSYSNARTLEEFIGYAKINLISDNSYKRFNK